MTKFADPVTCAALTASPTSAPCAPSRAAAVVGLVAACRRILAGLALLTWVLALMSRPAAAQGADVWAPIGPQASTVLALARDPFNPGRLVAGTYFGGIYGSQDWGYSWRHIPSPFSTVSVFALAFDPRNPQTLYAATFQKGVYKTTDGGLTWSEKNQGLTDLDIQVIAVHPFLPQKLFLGTSNGGVFASNDGGDTWLPVAGLAADLRARALAFDRNFPGVIYLGTIGQGVLKSNDNGVTWIPFSSGLRGSTVLSLEFDPPTGTLLYAATDTGASRLTTGSTTWKDITHDLPPFPLSALLPHPTIRNLVFAGTLAGVYVLPQDDLITTWTRWNNTFPTRLLATDPYGGAFHVGLIHGGLMETVDFGRTFFRADQGIQNIFVGALASERGDAGTTLYAGADLGVLARRGDGSWTLSLAKDQAVFDLQPDPTAPGTLFAGMEKSSVFKTTDAAGTWNAAGQGILPAHVYGLSQSASDPNMVFAGTSSGLYQSRDGGRSWGSGNTVAVPLVLSVAIDPVRSPIAYIGSSQGQVLRSVDGGFSFLPANKGLPGQDITLLKIAKWDRVYAVTAAGELYSTNDDGRNWYPTKDGVGAPTLSIEVDPERSWVLYQGTAGGGVYKSESAGIQWTAANSGLDLPYVFALAVDPRNVQVIYAGSVGRVYRSNDGALNWSARSAGLPADGFVTRLAVDPADSSLLYASVQGHGLFRSSNGGDSWGRVGAGLPTAGDVAFALHPVDGNSLLAGTELQGIFRSPDGGASWSESSDGMTVFVRSLVIDPSNTRTVYAASLNAGVFKTTDGGSRWLSIGLRDRNVFKLAIDPLNPNKVYAATSLGAVSSNDGGATWRMGQQAAFVYSLASLSGSPPQTFIGSVAGRLYRSADTAHWEAAGTGLPAANLLAMTTLPGGALLAAAERSGVFKSSDNGISWRKTSGAALDGVQVTALDVDATTGFVYASTNGSGIFLSLDAGENWYPVGNQIANSVVAGVAGSPVTAWTVFAATRDRGVFRSFDAGLSFAPVNAGLPTPAINCIIAAADGALYAGTATGVFKSLDAGNSWAGAGGSLAASEILSLFASPTNPRLILAGTRADGIHRSSDGGSSWVQVTPPTQPLSVNVLRPGNAAGEILAGTLGNGLLRSTNSGESWSNAISPETLNPVATAIVVDPLTPATLYLGTGGGGILKSSNAGIDWISMNDGLDTPFILALAIDPVDPRVVYAGTTGGGVFLTTNGAANWQAFNEGLFNRNVTSLAIDAADRRTIYVGTEGGGVFRRVRP